MSDKKLRHEYCLSKIKSSLYFNKSKINEIATIVSSFLDETVRINNVYELYSYIENSTDIVSGNQLMSYKDVDMLINIMKMIGDCDSIIDIWNDYKEHKFHEPEYAYIEWNKSPDIFYQIYLENIDKFDNMTLKYLKIINYIMLSINIDCDDSSSWEKIFEHCKCNNMCAELLEVLDNISSLANLWKLPENIARRETFLEDSKIIQIKDDFDNEIICCICLNDKPNIVFMPCKHLCSCLDCSNKVKKCPICRLKIKDKMKIFI